METTFVAAPYSEHKLTKRDDTKLVTLQLDVYCPNCEADAVHTEVIGALEARQNGIYRTDTKTYLKNRAMTYDERREITERAATLCENLPTHSLSECFRQFASRIEDLESEVRTLREKDNDY